MTKTIEKAARDHADKYFIEDAEIFCNEPWNNAKDLYAKTRTSALPNHRPKRQAHLPLLARTDRKPEKKMKTTKPILDACCGGKMFYFDKHVPNVLFQDIRQVSTTLCDGRKFEVDPDIIADFTSMPYPDNSFRMVVFDPPHLKYSGSKKELNGWQMIKYGALLPGWKDVISKGFAECFRVLKIGGFLIFKWNETDIKVSEILKLTPHKPIFGHISGKRSNTHWMCFMKEE